MNDIKEAIRARSISEVLHFTTSNGLLGTVTVGALLSHKDLPSERTLSHILQINCPDRSRDKEWHSYVNLSVSRINASFFSIAKNKWHATKDLYWCILSFKPEIMSHPKVYFSTTNNAYACAVRETGIIGFDSMFAESIRQFPDKTIRRPSQLAPNLTTCQQAEVLYPGRVPVEFLQRVYVPSEDIYCEAKAQIEICAPSLSKDLELVIAPELFGA